MSMLDKLAGIDARYDELERLMGNPAIMQDYTKVGELNKERSGLEDIVKAYHSYLKQAEDLVGACELLKETDDAEMREMAELEIAELESSTENTLEQLKLMLLPKDPRDGKNAIVEIRAGAGGDVEG